MSGKSAGSWSLVLALIAASWGCEGGIQLWSPEAGGGAAAPSPWVEPGGPVDPVIPEVPCRGKACEEPRPSAPPRFVRLTHQQWENTARDLLELPAEPGLSGDFLPDTLSEGTFDNNSATLAVDPRLWDDYREAAEALAAQVARDEQALARLLPEGAPTEPTEARARALIEHVGRRAYRRPLGPEEVTRHLALFDMGPELLAEVEGVDDFARGAELLLRVFLQSPYFLYRMELSHEEGAEVVALDGWERAAKLSYALWQTMPDEALFEAAAAGELDTAQGVRRQVERMLDDPRAREMVRELHGQLLHMERVDQMKKDPEMFPQFSGQLAQAMRRETELFVEEVVFGREAGVYELYTAPWTFVNNDLAQLYGLEGQYPADTFEPASLDPEERAGLLTRLAFLALEANAYEQSSIHRGVFVNLHVLCVKLPPIPDDVELPDNVMGATNRARVEDTTSGCGGACHNVMINPAGFAFEHYDALGRFQSTEGAHPVDASGSYPFAHGEQGFDDGVEFSQQIAVSEEAHTCYANHLFEFLYGRLPGEGDLPLVARLGLASQAREASIRDLMVALLVDEIFLARAGADEDGAQEGAR